MTCAVVTNQQARKFQLILDAALFDMSFSERFCNCAFKRETLCAFAQLLTNAYFEHCIAATSRLAVELLTVSKRK